MCDKCKQIQADNYAKTDFEATNTPISPSSDGTEVFKTDPGNKQQYYIGRVDGKKHWIAPGTNTGGNSCKG